ncbi:HD domain-containing protein [Streptomyces calidiresistens]|uniref:HD domain-containing protein n=1 Tax=Streptomyces calidiresistens TaxID=1485586 RepID=A0A7W3SZE2_9ACTN|nr:HD domain-containing protein [Streptomyces calidiresistens]
MPAVSPQLPPHERTARRTRRVDVAGLRRIRRAAFLGGAPRHSVPDAIEHLARAHRRHHPRAPLEVLGEAYRLAEAAHRGQFRKSGDPYITHPVAVTLILAELGAGTTTLTASLLHDTVEDTEVTLEEVRERFGPGVGHLVDGVTKLEKVDWGAAAEPETFRKMLVAAGSDVRVMAIKLADRLHNMRTLGVMRPEKQARIARVTRDVLIPLAERLGVQALKTELEDLVFAILHPEEHRRAMDLIRARAGHPDPLEGVAERVRAVLREAGIAAEVRIRPRHVFSVHRVLTKRGALSPHDFGRLLILVEEKADCYGVLGELHTCFSPVVSEFKDFIATPKFNLYQSLHTAIVDDAGEEPGGVAEVLVRTHRMHRVAEAGVVALPHAEADPAVDPGGGEGEAGERPDWLSRLLEWQREARDPDTFWTELREELSEDREIVVFDEDEPHRSAAGPTGLDPADPGPLHLPVGATCVDAAYARHGRRAHACVGARVNGRLVPLGTPLGDGDTVRLLLLPESEPVPGPGADWLEHARTPAARLAIRAWAADRPAPDPVAPREAAPARSRRRPCAGADVRPAPLPGGSGGSPGTTPAGAPAPGVNGDEGVATETGIVVEGPRGAVPADRVRLARCCTPVPADEVTAFPVRGGGVTVHRESCPAACRMARSGRSAVPVRWRDTATGCRVTLHAEALGRPHLLAELTEALAEHGASVLSAEVEPPQERRVRHTYTLRLPDARELPRLMRAMRGVPGVYDVVRALRTGA